MMIAEMAPGNFLYLVGGRHRLPREVAVHQFHGIGSGKRQNTGEHLVEGGAEA